MCAAQKDACQSSFRLFTFRPSRDTDANAGTFSILVITSLRLLATRRGPHCVAQRMQLWTEPRMVFSLGDCNLLLWSANKTMWKESRGLFLLLACLLLLWW